MSNTNVAIDAVKQLFKQDEEIEKLKAENEALRSQLARVREPLDLDAIDDLRIRYTNVIVCPHNEVDDYNDFAHAIHRTLLARIEGE